MSAGHSEVHRPTASVLPSLLIAAPAAHSYLLPSHAWQPRVRGQPRTETPAGPQFPAGKLPIKLPLPSGVLEASEPGKCGEQSRPQRPSPRPALLRGGTGSSPHHHPQHKGPLPPPVPRTRAHLRQPRPRTEARSAGLGRRRALGRAGTRATAPRPRGPARPSCVPAARKSSNQLLTESFSFFFSTLFFKYLMNCKIFLNWQGVWILLILTLPCMQLQDKVSFTFLK